MRTARQRLASCLVALVLTVLMSGCAITGTIDVSASQQVTLDLVIQGVDPANSGCQGGAEPFELELTRVGDQDWTCRITGTGPAAALESILVKSSWVDEFAALTFNQDLRDTPGPNADQLGLDDLDVTVRMPGPITESTGGERTGLDTIRFAGRELIGQEGGLRVVSVNHAGPPSRLWFVLGGLVVGAAGASLVWWGRGRRRARVAAALAGPNDVAVPQGEGVAAHPSEDDAAARRDPADHPDEAGVWPEQRSTGTHVGERVRRDGPDRLRDRGGRQPKVAAGDAVEIDKVKAEVVDSVARIGLVRNHRESGPAARPNVGKTTRDRMPNLPS